MKQEHTWFLTGSVSFVRLMSAGRKYCRKVGSGGLRFPKGGCPLTFYPEVIV